MTIPSSFPWIVVALLSAFCWWQHRRYHAALKTHTTDPAPDREPQQSASEPPPVADLAGLGDQADPVEPQMQRPTTAVDPGAESRVTEEWECAIRLESFGLLAGEAGHDFANHLAAILGHLSLAQLTDGLPAQAGVHLAEVERASNRARNLTEQLLTLARCETLDKQLVELPVIIGDSIASVLHDAPGVVTEFVVPDDLWAIEADAGQLTQVFNYLVVNAVHAMTEQSGVLRIVAGNIAAGAQTVPHLGEVPTVHIEIIDTGPGIPPGKLPRVFDPFFISNKKGTALGLTTVNYAIRKHGGHVEVESTLGVGTTFHVYLPAHPNLGHGSAAVAATEQAHRGEKASAPSGIQSNGAPDLGAA